MPRASGVPFVLMRGGTSKGVFLRRDQFDTTDPEALAPLLLALMGSPDRRQIDGLGGADKLTSKVAFIGAPTRPDADIDYLFAQVGVAAAEVDWKLNCGNLTAAAAVYAIEEGFVAAAPQRTRVRVHNVNTRRVITVEVPMHDGVPATEGELQIDGVPGRGAAIALDFAATAGAITGTLLPLGLRHALPLPGGGEAVVTVVDGANLVMFVAASALGLRGTEGPEAIDGDGALVARLDALRAQVAQRVGLGAHWASRRAPSAPFAVVVSPPADYVRYGDGGLQAAGEVDFVARQYSTGATSKAMAATVASVTGIAARLAGSVVQPMLGAAAQDRLALRIGHPSGAIVVEAALDADGAPARATIFRTARRLADGRAYLRHDVSGSVALPQRADPGECAA